MLNSYPRFFSIIKTSSISNKNIWSNVKVNIKKWKKKKR